jgi:hypothetical protein
MVILLRRLSRAVQKLLKNSIFFIAPMVLLLGCGGGGGGGNEPGNPPTAPSGVTAATGDTQTTIIWNSVAGATAYDIYWATSSGVTTVNGSLISNAPNPFTHQGLTNGTTYYYIVVAKNSNGSSTPSTEVNAIPIAEGTIPSAPQNVSATQGNSRITVSWNSVAGATAYDIYWATSSGVTTVNGSLISNAPNPFTHQGLTNGTTYYYIVVARNNYGQSPISVEISETPRPLPAPLNPTATAGNSQVTVTWSSVTGATSYDVYFSTTSGATNTGGTRIENVNSPYVHTTLNNGSTYYYIVTARNNTGESAPSVEVSATPGPPLLVVNTLSLNIGSLESSAQFTVRNTGIGTLNWSITCSESWLSVSEMSGTTMTETDILTASVARAGLSRGNYNGTISITSDGGNASIAVTLNVPNNSPVITSTPRGIAEYDKLYTYNVLANDIDGDTLVYSLKTSPPGMTIDTATGLVAWTPTRGGIYTIELLVDDGQGGSASQSFNIEIVTTVSGIINTSTTWTKQKGPYLAEGSIRVSHGVTLTIEPGVIVRFGGIYSFEIEGSLVARGTSEERIVFTTNFHPNHWGYIFFADSSVDTAFGLDGNYLSGSILEYCTIEYAGGANITNNGAVRLHGAHVFINHTWIQNNTAPGIYAWDISESLTISNSLITDCSSNAGAAGIGIIGKSPLSGKANLMNNTILNNFSNTSSTLSGGGIYLFQVIAQVWNNIIALNTTTFTGGGIALREGKGSIAYNIIAQNNVTGASGSTLGGGIYLRPPWATTNHVDVRNNLIIDNSSGRDGGAIGILPGYAPIMIADNIIANNYAAHRGGALYSHGGSARGNITIEGNSVVRNRASQNSVFYLSHGTTEHPSIAYNTITGNHDIAGTTTASIFVNGGLSINYNNISENTASYELWNANTQDKPDVLGNHNWWGTADDVQIRTKIYDYLDDYLKGLVNYLPYLTAMEIDAPISPPKDLVAASPEAGKIRLTWTANSEIDVAGYIIYLGLESGSYTNSYDVGKVSDYTLTDLATNKYYVTVTAYDSDYHPRNDNPLTIVNENQTAGSESWYAIERSVHVQ